jgi:TonB family protein
MLSKLATIASLLCATCAFALPQTQAPLSRIAVLDFGSESTGVRVAKTLREKISTAKGFVVVDRDAARAAASGAGYAGSLNLSTEETRDLGAAIGCDFFFVGDAQTLRRSPSTGATYYESFAAIFLASARSGRLVLWERPSARAANAKDAERALLAQLSDAATIHRYISAIADARAREAAERAERVEKGTPVIEIMSDETAYESGETRPPRPLRRLKPDYPSAAAASEIEAVVDALVDVDAQGEVTRVEIARWAGYGLDESVIATVKQLHFFPAMRNRRAIPMRILLRYNFRKPPPE